MNHYETLEVSRKASQEVLRAAYKSLIQRYHPDRNPGDRQAAERSRSVVEAYQVLSDPGKRAAYDIELKRQFDIAAGIRTRTHNALSSAPASGDARSNAHGPFWAVIALIVVALWYVWPTSEKESIPNSGIAAAPEDAAVLQTAGAADPEQEKANGSPAPKARTIPVYIENLKVDLHLPAKPGEPSSADARHSLIIKTLGIVVGSFDPERFISFLGQNKDYIGRQLAEKLAGADYELLLRNDGDRYLKRVILDSIGEITNTNRLEKYSLPGADSDARYGAVDVLLPDSFSLESQQANVVTIRTPR